MLHIMLTDLSLSLHLWDTTEKNEQQREREREWSSKWELASENYVKKETWEKHVKEINLSKCID